MRERIRDFFLSQAQLPLETAILLIAGLMATLTGIFLFPVGTGALPYYENGLYGLFLFIFALQMLTLGKTPFGDVSRSIPVIVIGIGIAITGIVTCFIPDLLSHIPRLLLFICFAPGGALLLLQMIFSKDKLRNWLRLGSLFRHLIFSCAAVYLLSILIGWLVLMSPKIDVAITALFVLTFGIAILYLAVVLRKVYLTYPEAETKDPGTGILSTDKMLLLVIGLFMVVLGALLIPVSLGQLPFAGSAQLGLLMVIFSIQMLALGSTPIGAFPRSRAMILVGFVFAGLGIISAVIPGILVGPLTLLIGLLNLFGGAISLGKMVFSKNQTPAGSPQTVLSVLRRLFITQLALALLSIMFGTSMLIPSLLPGLLVGVILFANGCLLLYLIYILISLDKVIKQLSQA
ncbi:MAG TPA: hypothetical protein PLU68_02465 [Thermotogota bacterium]|jgi:hypothetical protein|nr:hypothetical protein [Thermotogota bacterium]OQC30904.1 MAG: hypothetical protein BWX67_01505 [Thermotogota bacterium ADurb.Bin062]HOF24229.1 hypothetical protein [Thermotogota bacterium]HOS25538.1 hypothetical protein [Thermotogota bacterium]HPD35966.1 hypothetical protein [Thermotogota bacterium]